MSKALAIGYDALLMIISKYTVKCLIAVHCKLMADEEIESLTLDKRLMRTGEGKRDDGLIALMFNLVNIF